MKIEKLNDNQIRCTLTKEDLANRQIRLSELAYGSEKARELFKDMVQQANYEFGFDADDMPLMVEAIPVSSETIVLVISKVEYPDELDTRFSRFSEPNPELLDDQMQAPKQQKAPEGAADIIELFKKAYEKLELAKENIEAAKAQQEKQDEAKKQAKEEPQQEEKTQEMPAELRDFTRMFEVANLAQAERLSKVLSGFYHGKSALYKNPQKETYYMTLHKGDHSPEEFNKVCNIAAEYANQRDYKKSMDAYLNEHGYEILNANAVDILAELSE